jgi:hypothetical protein
VKIGDRRTGMVGLASAAPSGCGGMRWNSAFLGLEKGRSFTGRNAPASPDAPESSAKPLTGWDDMSLEHLVIDFKELP